MFFQKCAITQSLTSKKFSDLKVPVAFNAVNSETSKGIILKKGGIAEAMRASSSIPLLFKPFLFNGKFLIDGAVSNPLPSKIAKNLGADKVIGITFERKTVPLANMKGDFSFKELKHLTLSKLDNGIFKYFKRATKTTFLQHI